MSEFALYDVPTKCRDCGQDFTGKAFKPDDGLPRFGVCDVCDAIRSAPKLPHKEPDLDLRPPRRVFGEDD